ncbi:metalloregulator ArsR/SmtB family transcription factor [Nocardioides sp. SR21]|uniref:helix-turn-helix transcriptional regulator n=1 Tax=Nocardioides sp. SR21 TaxID=2919501 RepID=UPI001FAAF1B7|nr:helix-turn-helix domain-containing protein [Nocardioides sp. SR21]
MISVENNERERRGPRPARTASGRRLSPTRAALLETLQVQPEPTSLPALVKTTGLHDNTVREHLEGLRRSGLVRRTKAPATGRGRPRWLYEATPHSHEDPRPEYAGLAAALAAVIVRTSPEPAAEARRAGADWGRRLAAGTAPAESAEAARRGVTAIFEDMGFEPEADADVRELRLTRCPLLEAAHQEPDVVCSVHLGIAQGALERYDAPTDGLELLPFVEPGACLLRLGRP